MRVRADLAQSMGERAAGLHSDAQQVEQRGQLAADPPGALTGPAGEPEVGREEPGDGNAGEEHDGQATGRRGRESSAGESAEGGGRQLGGHQVACP